MTKAKNVTFGVTRYTPEQVTALHVHSVQRTSAWVPPGQPPPPIPADVPVDEATNEPTAITGLSGAHHDFCSFGVLTPIPYGEAGTAFHFEADPANAVVHVTIRTTQAAAGAKQHVTRMTIGPAGGSPEPVYGPEVAVGSLCDG